MKVEKYSNDMFSDFFFLFQVRSDYLKEYAEHVDPEVAIQLGCIEMRYGTAV